MTQKRVLSVAGLVVVMLLALASGVLASDPGEPESGTVRGLGGPHTFLSSAAGITETAYTSSPKLIYGQDVSLSWLYHSADVFLTVDVNGTDTVTMTPQLSADASNWADAYYQTVSGTTVTEQPYRIVVSADGTSYLRMPLAGKYLRFKVETSGTVTPTIKVLFRND